jgi:hypothetical protein
MHPVATGLQRLGCPIVHPAFADFVPRADADALAGHVLTVGVCRIFPHILITIFAFGSVSWKHALRKALILLNVACFEQHALCACSKWKVFDD